MIRRLALLAALLAALLPLSGFAQMLPVYVGDGTTELPSPTRLPRKARRPRKTRSESRHYRTKSSSFRRHNNNPSRRQRNRNAYPRHGAYAVAHYVIHPEPSREQMFQLREARHPRSTRSESRHYRTKSSSFRKHNNNPSRRQRNRNAYPRHGAYAVAHYVIRVVPSREQIFQLPEAQQ